MYLHSRSHKIAAYECLLLHRKVASARLVYPGTYTCEYVDHYGCVGDVLGFARAQYHGKRRRMKNGGRQDSTVLKPACCNIFSKQQTGRDHVCPPATNAYIVFRLLL